ncbi:hypothetical protein ACFL1K_01410 [Candidatus Omnitrophota bacterium]
MDKKRIEILITSVLGVIFILAWARTIGMIRRRARPAPQPSAAVSVPVGAVEGSLAVSAVDTVKAAEQEVKGLNWMRCPFSGKIYASETDSLDLKLSGIVWDELNPQALINARIVGVGDQIGGYSVVEIQQNKVILNDGKDNLILKQ